MHRVRELTKAVGNRALLDVYGRGARLLIELATEGGGLRSERSRAAPPVGSASSVTGAIGVTADAGALHVVVVAADGGLQHRRLP